jgi:hypothetical protein
MPMRAKIIARECGEAYGQNAIAAIEVYIEEIRKRWAPARPQRNRLRCQWLRG